MEPCKSWYDGIRGKLSGNGTWLRGQELNTLPETEFYNRGFRVLFARLSTYRDTAGSFTHRLLYQIAKDMEGIFPDMAFLPPLPDLKYFHAGKIPWLLPVKTKLHPCTYDLIGLSNSVVQELVNIPGMLAKSGIPLSKRERMQVNDIPLIILGGANAINTSALFCDDPLVDGIFTGDDTESIREILTVCRDGKQNKLEKAEILKQLDTVPGFFQPDRIRQLPGKINRRLARHAEQLKDAPVPYSENAATGFLRISEGCPYFCSFCSESWNRKPYTEESADDLYRYAVGQKANSGISNIDLFSFNFNIHSGLYDILWKMSGIFASTGLKSQRFDHIARNPGIIKLLQVSGKSGLTCGLEGISGRLRKYLHKNLENEVLYKSLELLLVSHIRELKIFLIATGKESGDDYAEFSELIEKIKHITRGLKHVPRIIFSITPLVRFPHTPLEFEDAPGRDVLTTVMNTVLKIAVVNGFEMRSAADFNEYYISQVLVRADDEKISGALTKAVINSGFTYYSSVTDNFVNEFHSALTEAGIDPAHLLRGHSPETRETKPWNIFESGISPDFFKKIYRECSVYQESEPCFGTGRCAACNACPDSVFVKKITHATQPVTYLPEDLHKKITARKNNIVQVHFLFSRQNAASGIPGEMAGMALARALMLSSPDLVAPYSGFYSSFWDTENKGSWVTGDNIITLLWEKQALPVIEQMLQDEIFIRDVNSRLDDGWGKLIKACNNTPLKVSLVISGYSKCNLQDFMQSCYLKYTLKKNRDNGCIYELSKDSLKKDIIRSFYISEDQVNLTVGKKFKPAVFFSRCFHAAELPSLSVISSMEFA